MVVVADGSDEMAERLERVLTADPGTGVLRHADAGYDEALAAAEEHGLARAAAAAVHERHRPAARPRPRAARDRSAGRRAPLRGAALRELQVVENAFVLCEGGTVAAAGPMRDLAIDAEVEELDGSGLCAIPGLVDCHTHPAFLGDRVEEFALRAGGASYEELHAAGGGILSTVRATRDGGDGELAAAVRRHADWMLRAGTTTFEGKSGYGLDRDTELASLEAVAAAGGVPTWLGAHAVPPEFGDADAYLDFALAEVSAARGRARRGGGRLRRGRRVQRRRRRAAT